MQIIYLGKELDSTKEHELLSDSEYGFKVTVTYCEASWMSLYQGKKAVDVFNNCTEVHHRFDSFAPGRRIAFESDILSTGCVRLIDEIESVNIELASELSEGFRPNV